jgi:tripartite-type tricarboxylate transporter receptor subunit TctC
VKSDADRKVMELFFTQKTIARPVIAPPGVPAERLDALRAAFAALAGDAPFLADAERSNLEVAPMAGEAVDKVVTLITATPADVADRFAKVIASPGQSR